VVKLNTNENPYPPSPRVLEAIAAAAADDVRLYPNPVAEPLCARAAEVYGVGRDQVLAGNGSDEVLMMIVRACIGAGERVAYAEPTYSLYDTLVAIGGGEVATVPYPQSFELPVEPLLGLRGKVTIVCNPNAPSGTLTPLDVIEGMAPKVEGMLVVDEAYADFAAASAVELIERHPNVVVVRSFSKSFSLAGLRIGLLFGQPAVVSELLKVKDSYNLSRISIAAGTAALGDLDWMRGNVAKVAATRARLTEELSGLGYSVLPSATNFVLARRPGTNQRPVFEALRERQILVRYFDVPELRDALRITVGTDDEIDALLAALRGLSVDG
jgi:histidinol-phosphate aminotransferase